MRERRIKLGGTELVLRMDARAADRLTRTWLYRLLLRSFVGRVSSNGRPAAVASRAQVAASSPTATAPIFYPRPVQSANSGAYADLAREIAEYGEWYHTIELAPGLWTSGAFDHTPALPHIPLPADLTGRRCLDVATLDGFWAFEMERRGASEVVALDIGSWTELDAPPYVIEHIRDIGLGPTGGGFEIAARALGSRVRREIGNVYDLDPSVFGQFDFVFCGDLLLHLRSPLRALERIHSVTRGEAVFVEAFDPTLDATGITRLAALDDAPFDARWWRLSRTYLDHALRLSGFGYTEQLGSVDIRLRGRENEAGPRAILRARRAAPAGKDDPIRAPEVLSACG